MSSELVDCPRCRNGEFLEQCALCNSHGKITAEIAAAYKLRFDAEEPISIAEVHAFIISIAAHRPWETNA